MKNKTYLCKEHGEEFLVNANSLGEAQEKASMYGGEAICEVEVTSRDGNRVEFIKPFQNYGHRNYDTKGK